MSFSFAGNKFNYRKNSDDYTDNSTRISTTSNVNITNTYNETVAQPDIDTSVDRDSRPWTKEDWLDYIRRVLYAVKNTIVEHEKMGEKLENIQYTDPKCSILEVSFLTEDGRLDKEVITYNELY
jgi:hypothetical protein